MNQSCTGRRDSKRVALFVSGAARSVLTRKGDVRGGTYRFSRPVRWSECAGKQRLRLDQPADCGACDVETPTSSRKLRAILDAVGKDGVLSVGLKSDRFSDGLCSILAHREMEKRGAQSVEARGHAVFCGVFQVLGGSP